MIITAQFYCEPLADSQKKYLHNEKKNFKVNKNAAN